MTHNLYVVTNLEQSAHCHPGCFLEALPAQFGPGRGTCCLATAGPCSPTSSPLRRSPVLQAVERWPQAPSTTYAFDTVNLPEFPITYLFWVLTLHRDGSTHVLFLEKKKKKTQWKKKLHSMHFFVLYCACMCLAEGTRPICAPVAWSPRLKIHAPSLSWHRPALPLSSLDGAPRREGPSGPCLSPGRP